MLGNLFVAEIFLWKYSILNSHLQSQKFGKYNHGTSFAFNNGGLCLLNSLSVRWHGFYLLLGLCVCWLVVTGVGFFWGGWVLGLVLGLLFGGYVWYWVCLFVGW